MSKIRIKVTPSGAVSMIYNEAYDMSAHGPTKIRRASQVEPNADGKWEADMSLLGEEHAGVILGPFDDRSDAITAEVDYINKHYLGVSH